MLRKDLLFGCMYLVEFNSADLFLILGLFNMLFIALSISKEVERRESFAFLVRINCLADLKKRLNFFLKKSEKNSMKF